jgi:hypothetical protein
MTHNIVTTPATTSRLANFGIATSATKALTKSPSQTAAAIKAEPEYTYLTTKELAARMRYSVIAVRNELKDSVLIEGVHYFRPFGGRKLLFIWEIIEADMKSHGSQFSFGAR